MKNVKNLVALTAVLTVLILAGGTLYSDLSAADDETVDTTDDSTVIQCVVLNEGFSDQYVVHGPFHPCHHFQPIRHGHAGQRRG